MAVTKLAELMELERSDGNALVLTVNEFEAADGKKPKFISVGLHGKTDGGEWRDLRKGITVRRGEIRQLIEALERAAEMIDDGRIDKIALSDRAYAEQLDWGNSKTPCLSETAMRELVHQIYEPS